MIDTSSKALINAALIALMAFTFIADLYLPHGVAGWVFYLLACLGSAYGGRLRLALLVAVACSVLVFVGFLFVPPGIDPAWEIANRGVAIVAIWSTVFVARTLSKHSASLADSSERLSTVVAERSRALASLNLSEQHLAAVINTATDAIITIDEAQRIVMINPAAEQLFGYAHGDLTGAPLTLLIPTRFHNAHPHHVSQFGGTGKSARRMGGKVDVFGARANGEEFPVDASISHFSEDGHIFYTVILRDISARMRAEAALTDSQRELRELSDNLLTVREEERKHISRELHDDLGQRLAALRNDLTLLRKGLDNLPGDSIKLARNAESIDHLLVDTIASLRRISSDLRPRPLDDLGLIAAIRVLAGDFSKNHKVRCTLDAAVVEPHLDSKIAVALYRMVQESLNNAAKHAAASEVSIKFFVTDGKLIVQIADDGVGMAESAMRKPGSFGLIGMRERAAALGGSLVVNSTPGAGTCLQFSVPVDNALLK